MAYDLKSLKAPRAAGGLLRALVKVLETPGAGGVVTDKLLADSGFLAFRELPATRPLDASAPIFEHGQERAPADWRASLDPVLETLPDARRGFLMETSTDFVSAYRSGALDVTAVAERAIEIGRACEQHSPPMRILIAQREDDVRRQAEASAARYAKGAPLGPLDGVPVAVKDEVDQVPYPTTVGTRFLGHSPARADAEVVVRLRRAGALLIGKANMHEIGIGVTGINPHHGAVRNPYDPACLTGGSSSGSAAAVAVGMCPIAVGADGGGSIRMPAALCGQVGLKPTFGRVSEHGAAELCWSVAHIGPIASTVRDCALAYAVMCGPDDKDENSQRQPTPELTELGDGDLHGVRLGLYRPWFEDADPDVVSRAHEALEVLRRAGATIVDVTINELDAARIAHAITIVTEMATAHLGHYERHREAYGHDTRINLALGRRLLAADYIHAQRHRAAVYRRFAAILEEVDAIVTPTTAITAPTIRDDALAYGESDLAMLSAIMRYATPANLTGLPAISVPAGYDRRGLPVGLQLMGRGWEEHLLLRLAAVVERHIERHKPRVWFSYLNGLGAGG